ncbi:hypothetical protein EV672_105110 [Aquabacterium commune]|uniref:Uncharacterized protein n=1 Tax=Aquabacterium commune TaxID=70586 RepID=A0A4R6RA23_9BURK|nr:hypothetical protein EV672_105110 [Aquabacterium commune]
MVSRDAPVVAGMRNPKLRLKLSERSTHVHMSTRTCMRAASHKPEEPAITAAFGQQVNALGP